MKTSLGIQLCKATFQILSRARINISIWIIFALSQQLHLLVEQDMSVLVQTSIGNITIDLHTEDAPKESQNFLALCMAKFFTFCPVHQIDKDFLAQFGLPKFPLCRQGSSAWHLADPFTDREFKVQRNKHKANQRGAVSYVTRNENGELLASSVVSITLADLTGQNVMKDSVPFGTIVEGLDILDKLNDTIVDKDGRPLQDVRIHRTYVLYNPFTKLEGITIPPSTPEPSAEQLSTVRIDDLEELNLNEDQQDASEDELKRKRQRDANSKAITLELMGDITNAEQKPLDTVLFVCKLNPITTSSDLATIFARFGQIRSCEVIKDERGDSLCYAFIEYDTKEAVERAYGKMESVLIDDRRIHVDFSQSVKRLGDKWKMGQLGQNKRFKKGF